MKGGGPRGVHYEHCESQFAIGFLKTFPYVCAGIREAHDVICEPVIAAVLCNPRSVIRIRVYQNVPSIHASTRASIDVDPCRLRCRAKSTTACSWDCAGRVASCHCWCRLGKTAHPYLSGRLPSRKRDRSTQH